MIAPNKVAAMAEKKEKENYAFRTFLKNHADPDKLDAQFLRLHNQLFSQYDCNSCRNCCKEFCGTFENEDITKGAAKLHMTPETFKAQYLQYDGEGAYDTNHTPCDFLQEDGSCLLGECKPVNCAEFPFTARPDRLSSMINIIGNASVCPVLFEILERLKGEYGFEFRSNARW